jgi:hypothetical protein
VFEEIDTQPERGARKGGRRILLVASVLAVAIGVTGALAITQGGSSTPAKAPIVEQPAAQPPPPQPPLPAPPPEKEPEKAPEIIPGLEEQPDTVTEEPDMPDVPDVPAPGKPAHHHHHKKPTKTAQTPTKTAQTPPPDAQQEAVPPTKPTKVEWNPTMLLPADKGSGTKR